MATFLKTPGPKIAVTGFVSSDAGSMAGANGLLLKALLERGCGIQFFSKPEFVDPRPIIGTHPGFQFHDASNPWADQLRKGVGTTPVLGFLAGRFDSFTYHRAILKAVSAAHAEEPFDEFLWLGDYARGRVPGLCNIAFAQGPPGTDARSVLRHFSQIRQLAGFLPAWKWRVLARMRLSRLGLPPFHFSDHIIVGSSQSRTTLGKLFGLSGERVSTLPYPVDLETFRPEHTLRVPGELRCLWLGRIVPRKRIDLFLDAAEMAIARGMNLRLTIAGDVRMIASYANIITAFPHPERLVWRKHVPRIDVPQLIHEHDLLIQPSEEEDFGSSVAEAQACGIPVILGSTNGNRDYLGPTDIVLKEDSATALVDAIAPVYSREPSVDDQAVSRSTAERYFHIDRVADRLLEILCQQRHPHAIPGKVR